jgi:ribonuclease P protein component
MFSKQKRLKTKDVLFLTKKRIYFGSDFFWFFYVAQYPNIKHNQCSFHVSIKYNKNAVHRNAIKRAVIQEAERVFNKNTFQSYYKVFITLNKNKIPLLQKEFENMEKKDIILRIQSYFNKSFIALSKHLWKSSTISSSTAQRSWIQLHQKIKNNVKK